MQDQVREPSPSLHERQHRFFVRPPIPAASAGALVRPLVVSLATYCFTSSPLSSLACSQVWSTIQNCADRAAEIQLQIRLTGFPDSCELTAAICSCSLLIH